MRAVLLIDSQNFENSNEVQIQAILIFFIVYAQSDNKPLTY